MRRNNIIPNHCGWAYSSSTVLEQCWAYCNPPPAQPRTGQCGFTPVTILYIEKDKSRPKTTLQFTFIQSLLFLPPLVSITRINLGIFKTNILCISYENYPLAGIVISNINVLVYITEFDRNKTSIDSKFRVFNFDQRFKKVFVYRIDLLVPKCILNFIFQPLKPLNAKN